MKYHLVTMIDENGHTLRNDTVCSDHYLNDRELLALCPSGEFLQVFVLDDNRCVEYCTIERR